MLTTVIFDLDQTLIDRDATFRLFLEKQQLRLQEHLGNISFERFYATVKLYDNNGYRAKDEVYRLVCADLGLELTAATTMFKDYTKFYRSDPILFEDVHQVLSDLKKHYTLGLISNGKTINQNAKIDNANLRNYFKCIVVSETEGIKKPDIRIFQHCLERLNVSAEEAVYVGDNPENDVRAAQLSGMKAIWRRNSHYDEIDFADGIINQLSDLPELLKTFSKQRFL